MPYKRSSFYAQPGLLRVLDKEIEYQLKTILPNRNDSGRMAKDVLALEEFVAKLRGQFVNTRSLLPCLDTVREIAGIALRILEHHGCPPRS